MIRQSAAVLLSILIAGTVSAAIGKTERQTRMDLGIQVAHEELKSNRRRPGNEAVIKGGRCISVAAVVITSSASTLRLRLRAAAAAPMIKTASVSTNTKETADPRMPRTL